MARREPRPWRLYIWVGPPVMIAEVYGGQNLDRTEARDEGLPSADRFWVCAESKLSALPSVSIERLGGPYDSREAAVERAAVLFERRFGGTVARPFQRAVIVRGLLEWNGVYCGRREQYVERMEENDGVSA